MSDALTEATVLSNGMLATLEMPDMLKFADGSFDIPNSAQNDIYNLIYGGNFSVEPMAQLNFDRQRLRGMYALASIVYAEPHVVLGPEDAVDGAISHRSLTWGDVLAAWNFFRIGPIRSLSAPTNQEPSMGAQTGEPAAPGEPVLPTPGDTSTVA